MYYKVNKSSMAKLYKTNGDIEEVKPKQGKYFTLEELQGYVGGYIEEVITKDGKVMFVNEEGKINDLPSNKLASDEYANDNDIIVGNAIKLEDDEVEK